MLARIMRIFELDRSWKKQSHSEIKAFRELHLGPHVDAFFTFVEGQYELVKDQRGLLRSALGYAVRQHGALTRFFDDGRLKLTNNGSERELRRVATGRTAWLFCGKRRPCASGWQPPHARRVGSPPWSRSRGILARLVPRPAAMAARPLYRARAQVLDRYPRSLGRRSARDRDWLDHDPAAARAIVGELRSRVSSRIDGAITSRTAEERCPRSGYLPSPSRHSPSIRNSNSAAFFSRSSDLARATQLLGIRSAR